MKSPTAFWNHRCLDLQKKRGSVLVRQHWETGRHCPLCTCASSSIPRPEFSYTHIHTPVCACTLMTICGATLPHLSHYKEEPCDNAVIYFIAPSLRLVWSLPLCTSLSVYISRQILSSRRLGFREQAPLFTHTSHVCACASFVSMERCCQMPFSFKPLVLHKCMTASSKYIYIWNLFIKSYYHCQLCLQSSNSLFRMIIDDPPFYFCYPQVKRHLDYFTTDREVLLHLLS